MERLEYETQYGESNYKFVEEGGWVSLYVNEKLWGASDGDRFIKALLQDIRELEMLVKNCNIGDLDFNGVYCEYCSGKPLIDRKPLMSSGKGDYTVFINSCNHLEDSEIGDWNSKFSLYGVKINYCPVCGRRL